jgi:hypothetical protein
MQYLLEHVWQQIRIDYEIGNINSERCMQAAYYYALRSDANKPKDLRIFIEPEINFGSSRYPDIVVCENHFIRAIIELKFTPHGYANFEIDLEKLIDFSTKIESPFPLEIDPSSGRWSDKKYIIFPETWFVFAAICRYDARAVSAPDISTRIPSRSGIKFLHQRGRVGIPGDNNSCIFEQSVI